MRSARGRLTTLERAAAARRPDEMEDEADGVAERDVVLTREEFEMLQTFHRFVPLPALTSRILRVYCEDDLQVPEASDTTAETAEEPPMELSAVCEPSRPPLRQSGKRLAKNARKPHFQIDLSAQTPRHIQAPATTAENETSRVSGRSEQPETRD